MSLYSSDGFNAQGGARLQLQPVSVPWVIRFVVRDTCIAKDMTEYVKTPEADAD